MRNSEKIIAIKYNKQGVAVRKTMQIVLNKWHNVCKALIIFSGNFIA